MEASTDLFINLIQNCRILYDKSLREFKNTRKKEEAWQKIAAVSRMNVDSAKKRYFSLRQKYCREKKNIETRRRNKLPPRQHWVYYERLHFLDSFIQPRSTYTNDYFEEDDDEQMDENETVMANLDEYQPSNVDIQLQEGIDINEMNSVYGENENSEIEGHPDEQIIELSQNASNGQIFDYSNSNDERIETEIFISQYTGEVSRLDYVPNDVLQHHEDENSTRDNETMIPTEHQQQSENSIDLDNYMSPHAGPSSSTVQIIPSSLRNVSTGGKRMSVRENTLFSDRPAMKQLHPNNLTTKESSTQNRSSKFNSSAPQKNASKNTTSRPDQCNRTNTSSIQETAAPFHAVVPSEPSKEQRIEAIRQRMESCLTAITNKATEKTQRSPHAPFLSYLGTKLPNVPNEILPNLEREILKLVESHSK